MARTKAAPTVKRKCMIKGCGGQYQARGLCHTCYMKALGRMRTQEVSEQQLIELKMLLPSRQGQRATPSPFDTLLDAALAAK